MYSAISTDWLGTSNSRPTPLEKKLKLDKFAHLTHEKRLKHCTSASLQGNSDEKIKIQFSECT